MKINVRLIYLYLFTSIGLIVSVIGATRLVELGLKMYVFKGADQVDYYTPPLIPGKEEAVSSEEAKMAEQKQKELQVTETKRQREREASGAIAMLLIGLPLYKYHWSIIQKENKKKSI